MALTQHWQSSQQQHFLSTSISKTTSAWHLLSTGNHHNNGTSSVPIFQRHRDTINMALLTTGNHHNNGTSSVPIFQRQHQHGTHSAPLLQSTTSWHFLSTKELQIARTPGNQHHANERTREESNLQLLSYTQCVHCGFPTLCVQDNATPIGQLVLLTGGKLGSCCVPGPSATQGRTANLLN